eukprot:6786357-Pyramimonas_sp.AAC.1
MMRRKRRRRSRMMMMMRRRRRRRSRNQTTKRTGGLADAELRQGQGGARAGQGGRQRHDLRSLARRHDLDGAPAEVQRCVR